MKKRLVVLVCMLVLAMGLVPGLAFAQGMEDLRAGASELTTQSIDLSQCTVKFNDSGKSATDSNIFRCYYVKGDKAVAKPSFDLYVGKVKVPKSAYTVSYELTWYDDEEGDDVYQPVSASQLYPSKSPVANVESMASEFRITVKAKPGSGYVGEYSGDEQGRFTANVIDYYNVGRYMDCYLTKAKEDWRYAINPMNGNYFVIPQANAKATLNSLTLRAGGTPASGGMMHDGTKVSPGNYTVSYYLANKNAVDNNMSPASSAKVGSKLKSMPTTPGSYVMIIQGKGNFYGMASTLFDIQGSMADVKIAAVPAVKENGKEKKPALTVTYKGHELKEGVDYEVEYRNNVKAGIATAIVMGSPVVTNDRGCVHDVDKARYFTGSKKVTFKIIKNKGKTWKTNTMKASANTISVKASKLRKRGNAKFPRAQAFNVSNAKGTVTYEQITGNSLITVSKKGIVTVAQHAGFAFQDTAFNVKVRVSAKGTSAYYATSKVVNLTVKIK